MFVISLKSSRLKSTILTVAAVAAVVILGVVAGKHSAPPAANNDGLSLKASTAAERLAFVSQLGWEVTEDPSEVAEVIIPAEFDVAYEGYNNIQKQQGLDLTAYAGMRVKRWTYDVTNYPGYEGKEGVIQLNLLVCDGLVIGGDVCSLELNGFLKGFYKE